MRYFSFSTGDYLFLDNVSLNNNLSLLEISVGLGSLADLTMGKAKEYCGIDIACDVIDYLKLLYKKNKFIRWYCLDVCKENSFLNKRFDIVYSAHTLEHVESPQGFFNFIKRHLKTDGVAIIIYPNESKNQHHGISWFNNKKELVGIIDGAGLEIFTIFEIRETMWHKLVRKIFWEIPKSIILTSRSKNQPQTFEKTEAFKITHSHSIKRNFFAFYAKIITKLAAIFPLYKYVESEENIQNKTVFIRLKNK